MSDNFTEVTSQGFGGKLKDALVGVVFGLGLFIGSFPLIWWNEGRAITQTESLNEGAKAVIDVAVDNVVPGNEGKLVHLTGTIAAREPLTEPDFGFTTKGLKLTRVVEMYQWVEHEKTEKRKKLGGGTETTKTYSYDKQWKDEPINSSRFRHEEGHENPGAFPINGTEITAQDAHLGGFSVGDDIVGKLKDPQNLPAPEGGAMPQGFTREGAYYYQGDNPQSPKLGDVRVSYTLIPEGNYSVVARQGGASLGAYQTKAGNPILLVAAGSKSAAEMFQKAQEDNNFLTWLLRGLGLVMMWIGLGLFFRPFAALLDVIPFLGNIAETGIAIAAGLLALLLGSLTVAVAWVAHRPLVTIAMLLLAGGVGYLMMKRRNAAKSLAAPAMAPPPPPGAGLPPPPPR
jgi:hypothetical protein